eukprot:11963510-Ditylum_brightwellii.AAC.1
MAGHRWRNARQGQILWMDDSNRNYNIMGSKGIRTGKFRNAGVITDRRNGPLVPNDVPKTLLHIQQ